MKVAVIGSGSWGTALALHTARIGHDVWLWARRPDVAAAMDTERVNTLYLPGFPFPPHIRATSDLAEAIRGAALVLLVVPSHGTRSVLGEMKSLLTGREILVCASKGIENDTLARLSEVVSQVFEGEHDDRFVVLSGPSFAAEVARGIPTAIVAASHKESSANLVQKELSSGSFRIYTNDDVVGVELGGALKNVIAIATGGVTGLGLGHNTVAAIITRGLAEMTRLAVATGGHVETLSGLAGLGDLVLTCTGDLSRNRYVGVELGKGRSLDAILADMREVAEGVRTTRAARELGIRAGVELPITNAVYSLLYEGGRPRAMADALMGRPLKKE